MTDTPKNDRNLLSLEERQRSLREASRRYLRGEITLEQLEDAEQRYAPDYASAISSLADKGSLLWQLGKKMRLF